MKSSSICISSVLLVVAEGSAVASVVGSAVEIEFGEEELLEEIVFCAYT